MQQTTDNLELFYDCLDNSNNFLYEIYHKPYFELLEMTVQNILCGEIKQDLDDDDKCNFHVRGIEDIELLNRSIELGRLEKRYV